MANEKRLIDANALIAEHCKDCPADIQAECKIDPMCGGMMWLVEAPTVDAVPVVRCKDCIHALKDANGDLWCYGTQRVFGMYYCASGERREGE